MKQIEIHLDGLSCANCAAKIEKKMNEREDISLAILDFNTRRLVIEVEDNFSSDKFTSIENDIKSIEEVEVHFEESDSLQSIQETKKSQSWALKIIVGSSALVISLLFNTIIAQIYVLSAYLYIGYPVLKKAILRIRARQWFDENFLMSLATMGALMINEWPEAIGVMLFYTVGEYFQDRAVQKSQQHISKLLDIQVHEAIVLRNSELISIKPEKVRTGELIYVPLGAKIACDGIITEGYSSLNVSSLTGESIPIDVMEGDHVSAGSMNLQQPLTIKVTSEYKDTSLAKLVQYLKEASLKKAKLETTMTKFASVYTPIVVFLAISLFVILISLGYNLQDSIYRSLVFLVISCPCALVISVPLSYFAAMGYSSKHGILFKGGLALEAARKIDMILFDKTGTLTSGELSIELAEFFDQPKELSMSIAKSLEMRSSHPIAKAIVEYAKDSPVLNLENMQEHIGVGMSGIYNNQTYYLRKLILEDKNNLMIKHTIYENSHLTWIIMINDTQPVMLLGISDKIKPSAYSMIKDLKRKSIKLALLSGDLEEVVLNVKDTLNLDEAYGSLMPSDKVEIAQNCMNEHQVAFVGDGVNDSAVLSLSHLGIAMGLKGSDLAIQSADVVLLKDDLVVVPMILDIAKKSYHSIIQNLVLVFLVKAVVLLFGSLGLMGMWEAVFADVGVALIAILNAMRILYLNIH
jgi:Zn2+/Cd2+-exporting ATPase